MGKDHMMPPRQCRDQMKYISYVRVALKVFDNQFPMLPCFDENYNLINNPQNIIKIKIESR